MHSYWKCEFVPVKRATSLHIKRKEKKYNRLKDASMSRDRKHATVLNFTESEGRKQ